MFKIGYVILVSICIRVRYMVELGVRLFFNFKFRLYLSYELLLVCVGFVEICLKFLEGVLLIRFCVFFIVGVLEFIWFVSVCLGLFGFVCRGFVSR